MTFAVIARITTFLQLLRMNARGNPSDMSYVQQPLLIAVSHDPLRLATSRQRPWDGVLARWRSLNLDAQLAAGAAAEDQRLRLVRASQLTTPRSRDKLAARWEGVLAHCLSPK